MQKTNIGYLTHTWNPICMRCTPVGKGCQECWHLKLCNRFMHNPNFTEEQRKAYAGGKPVLLEKEHLAPLHRKKPAVIGVQFMGDLFHKKITFGWIHKVFEVMYQCPQHTYIVLTKRLHFLQSYIETISQIDAEMGELTWSEKPNPNIWLGTSISTQDEADKQNPELLRIPAAKRVLSIEPCLGEIDLIKYLLIDHVIVGCESGRNRRPCKLEWIRSIVQQCKAASVPCFVKQIEIDGKVSHNPEEWPEDLRRRELL